MRSSCSGDFKGALSLGTAAYHAIFHSISAFCNAGFSLYNTSLIGKEWLVVITMGALVVLGGWGFLVVYNLGNLRVWKKDKLARGRLTLQSRIVLWSTAVLVGLGFIAFLSVEWNAGMSGQSFPQRMLNSLFCAVTPRTAGFNTINYSEMSSAGGITHLGLEIRSDQQDKIDHFLQTGNGLSDIEIHVVAAGHRYR